MNKIKLFLILLIACYSVISANPNEEKFHFHHLQTKTGLSQNDVISLFQDSRGFMWIGTNDGLNRYDGYSFRIFQHDPDNKQSLTSNLISCMDEDPMGNLWLGTSDGHICMFDRNLEIFKPFEKILPFLASYPNWAIYSIKVEKANRIWAGTSTGLYLLYSEEENAFPDKVKHFNYSDLQDHSLGEDIIHHINYDSAGNIWIGTNSGLFLCNAPASLNMPWEASFKKLSKHGDNTVFSILPLEDFLLIAFADGLYILELSETEIIKPTFRKISDEQFRYLSIDTKNRIWAGSRKGVFLFSICLETKEIIFTNRLFHDNNDPQSLSSDIIRAMLIDRDGSVWIGTRGGGLNIHAPSTPIISHFSVSQSPGSIPAKRVVGLFHDSSGNLWLGSEGGGLSVLPFEIRNLISTGFIHLEESRPDKTMIPVCFTEWCYNGTDTVVFYGQGGGVAAGLGKVKLIGNKIDNIPILPELTHEIYSLQVVGGNELWAGTYGQGIICIAYDPNLKEFKVLKRFLSDLENKNSLPSNVIRGILEDREGNIWVGTSNGLSFLPAEEKGKVDPVFLNLNSFTNNPRELSNNYIIPIFESSLGKIWVGTLGEGLMVISRKNNQFEIKRVTMRDGLPNNSIKGIIEDIQGMMWISTNRGLSRVNPETTQIRNFGIDDGLQDMEFSEAVATSLPDGNLIFGGVNGLNIFNPEELQDEPRQINVLLTEFYILNQLIRAGDLVNGRTVLPATISEMTNVKLKYRENSFGIDFSDLHFFKTSKNMFRYRLVGFDNDWVVLGRNERSARYTNVPKGKYTFQVSATDIDGNWEGTPIKEMELVIQPPWWQSIIAYIIYTVLFASFLILFRRYTIVAVEEKNKYAMERFKNEQIEQLTQAKLSFFTNISHEFRSPLSLIVGPLEKLLSSGKKMAEEKRQHYYYLMQRNSHLMLRLIDQLMDFRRLEEGKMNRNVIKINLNLMLVEIMDVFEELAKSKSIRFEIITSNQNCELWFDVDKLEKILYNLLSNAFKNVDENGYVKIMLNDQSTSYPEFMEVRIINSGKGISAEKLNTIFERFSNTNVNRSLNTNGVGIGLAFTKTLVELHQGRISVSSTPEVETCFIIYFRKGKEHFLENELIETTPPRGSLDKIAYKHSSFFLQRKTDLPLDRKKDTRPEILIIEDNPELLYFLSESLSEKYQVNSALNGEEGLELCLRLVPDLIVSDIIMPKMDGYEFCNRLKSDERLNHIPLILLTSKSTEADQIAGLRIGAESYISKPFSIEVLEAQISSILLERKRLRSHFAQNMKIESTTQGHTSLDMKFLNKLTRLIDDNLSNPLLSVKFIASEFGMDQALFNKKLKALTDMTANTFIRNYRLRKAASLIEKNRYFVLDVAYEVGFNDLKYFRNCFKSFFQMTPSEYAKKFRDNKTKKLN